MAKDKKETNPVAEKKVSQDDKQPAMEEPEKQQKRQPVQAFMIGVVCPMFVIWLAWALFPLIYHKDILGGLRDFSDCEVLKYDS